jgi:hypothetical protein
MSAISTRQAWDPFRVSEVGSWNGLIAGGAGGCSHRGADESGVESKPVRDGCLHDEGRGVAL